MRGAWRDIPKTEREINANHSLCSQLCVDVKFLDKVAYSNLTLDINKKERGASAVAHLNGQKLGQNIPL